MRVFLFAQRVAVHGAHPDRARSFLDRAADRYAVYLSARSGCGSSLQGSQKN